MLFTALLTLNSTKLKRKLKETVRELQLAKNSDSYMEGKSKKSLLVPNLQSNDSVNHSSLLLHENTHIKHLPLSYYILLECTVVYFTCM